MPSVFYNKIIKKETLAQLFSSEFSEISKNILFYRTLLERVRLLHLIRKRTRVYYGTGQEILFFGQFCIPTKWIILFLSKWRNSFKK